MSKLAKIFLLGFFVSLPLPGEEKEKITLPQDKLTLERARASLAELEKGNPLVFKPLFDLPKEPKTEIIDTKLTYQKALAALAAYQKKHPPKQKADRRVLYQKPAKKK